MTDRIIPIFRDEHPCALPVPRVPDQAEALQGPIADMRARPLTDLRISVTDRCNFRCGYCMPRAVFDARYRYLPHADLLRFEEIARLARLFARLGGRKIRLTGGEPLLRKGIEALVAQLAVLRTLGGEPLDLALTTNGVLLPRKARVLRDAGLRRVTVSLDTLDNAMFRSMGDTDFSVTDVLAGVDAARAEGLSPVKVNMVVRRGVNERQILPLARYFRSSGIILRFIEFMDVGATNGWRLDQVVPSSEVLTRLRSEFALVPLAFATPGETAGRWGYVGINGRHDPALGEVGLIGSVTQAFCGACSRVRLSTDGRLYLCLFAGEGYDLRALLRGGASDDELVSVITAIWRGRSNRYSELRMGRGEMPSLVSAPRRIEMSYIGG